MTHVTSTSRGAPINQATSIPDDCVVKAGDTLGTIAQENGVSVKELLAANPQIKDPNRIFPGQHVKIPSGDKKGPAAESPPPKATQATQGAGRKRTSSAGNPARGRLESDLTPPPPPTITLPQAQAPRAVAPNPSAAPAPGDVFKPSTVSTNQHFHLKHNAHVKPETYGPGEKQKMWASLDARNVAYPPIEDEAHVNGKTRTIYASVERRSGALVVSLDNAAYHSAGYKGLSKGERQFAQDMAEYGKQHGLTTIFMAHVPPTVKAKDGALLPNAKDAAAQVKWMNSLHEKFPDSLWLHGHTHPGSDRMLDLNGATGGREVSNVILAGQVRDSLTRITTCENGRRIEEFKLVGHRLELVKSVALSRTGQREPPTYDLGKPKGALYGISDVHDDATFKRYYQALQADAEKSQAAGLGVAYLDVGDHTVKNGRIPVELPRGGHYYFAAGNHDYYNHGNLAQVVNSFLPDGSNVPFRVDYAL